MDRSERGLYVFMAVALMSVLWFVVELSKLQGYMQCMANR